MIIVTKSDLEKLIPAKDVAILLRTSIRTLRRWVKVGIDGRRLVATKLGGKLFFAAQDIEAFKAK